MGDTAPEIVLRGESLSRSFGHGKTQTKALDDVSITVRAGEFALLMGPSGSGKSTLLAVISGLLHPDTGSVEVLGQNLWKMTDIQREQFRLKHFGFIFQGYNLFSSLTARQQLEMILRWGEGTSPRVARRRSEEMLTLLGLGERINSRPSELSGGEKQRVAIGRALIKDPKFCFADEPTSALDWAHGEQVIELLRNAAHDRGSTVIVVSHDKRVVPFADRVFEMEDGRMTSEESAEQSLRTEKDLAVGRKS